MLLTKNNNPLSPAPHADGGGNPLAVALATAAAVQKGAYHACDDKRRLVQRPHARDASANVKSPGGTVIMRGQDSAGDPDAHIFQGPRSLDGGAGPRPRKYEHERWPLLSSSSRPSQRRYKEEDDNAHRCGTSSSSHSRRSKRENRWHRDRYPHLEDNYDPYRSLRL